MMIWGEEGEGNRKKNLFFLPMIYSFSLLGPKSHAQTIERLKEHWFLNNSVTIPIFAPFRILNISINP